MADIASLSFDVDSSGLARATEQMAKLTEQTRRLMDENRRLAIQNRELTAVLNTQADAQDRLSRTQKKEEGSLVSRAVASGASLLDAALNLPFDLVSRATEPIGSFAADQVSKFGQLAGALKTGVERRFGSDPLSQISGMSESGESIIARMSTPDMKAQYTEMRLLAEAAGVSLKSLVMWREGLQRAGTSLGEATNFMKKFEDVVSGIVDPTTERYLRRFGLDQGPYDSSADLAAKVAAAIDKMPTGRARNEATQAFFGSSGIEAQAAVEFIKSASPARKIALEIEADIASIMESRRRTEVKEQDRSTSSNDVSQARGALSAYLASARESFFSGTVSSLRDFNFEGAGQNFFRYIITSLSSLQNTLDSLPITGKSDREFLQSAPGVRANIREMLKTAGYQISETAARSNVSDPEALNTAYMRERSKFFEGNTSGGRENFKQWSVDEEVDFWTARRDEAKKQGTMSEDVARTIEQRYWEARRAAVTKAFQAVENNISRERSEAGFIGSSPEILRTQQDQLELTRARMNMGILPKFEGEEQIRSIEMAMSQLVRAMQAQITNITAQASLGAVMADTSAYIPQAQAAVQAGQAPATAVPGAMARAIREQDQESLRVFGLTLDSELSKVKDISLEQRRRLIQDSAKYVGDFSTRSDPRLDGSGNDLTTILVPREGESNVPDSVRGMILNEAVRRRQRNAQLRAAGAMAYGVSQAPFGALTQQEMIFNFGDEGDGPYANPYGYRAGGPTFTRQLRLERAQTYVQGVFAGADAPELVRRKTEFSINRLADQVQDERAQLREEIASLRAQTQAIPAGSGAVSRAAVNVQAEMAKEATKALTDQNTASRLLAEIEDRRKDQIERLKALEDQRFAQVKAGTEEELRLARAEFELLGKSNVERVKTIEYERALIQLKKEAPDKGEAEIEALAKQRSELAGVRQANQDATIAASQYAQAIATNVERAIVNFKDLKSVAYAFVQDIQTVLLRQTLTIPLQNALTGAIAKSGITSQSQNMFSGVFDFLGKGIGSIFSGLFAEGGVMTAKGPADMSKTYIRAFADGGVMQTPRGALDLSTVPVSAYDGGGVATSPRIAVFGEGRKPEAYVPMEDGRTVPFTIRKKGDQVEAFVNLPNGKSIPASLRIEGDAKKKMISSFADGGVMTSAGPSSLPPIGRAPSSKDVARMLTGGGEESVRPLGQSSVSSSRTSSFETKIEVNVNGGGEKSREFGQEVGAAVSKEVSRMMRAAMAEELRKQSRFGGILNPGLG